jgi:hypothetical protein
MGDTSHQDRLLDKLDFLRLELDIAREKDFEFMQKHIKRQITRVERELVDTRKSKPTDAESVLEGYR